MRMDPEGSSKRRRIERTREDFPLDDQLGHIDLTGFLPSRSSTNADLLPSLDDK